MKMRTLVAAIIFTCTQQLVAGGASALFAQGSIPPGTEITMQNWERYRNFMPEGMIWLFQGKYFWAMPPDIKIELGPTTPHSLPQQYMALTRRNSAQVKAIQLPDGTLHLQGYQGGEPFPNPSGDHEGWEILADLWYRYLPHLSVGTYDTICTQDSASNRQCSAYEVVYRQLSYITDSGTSDNSLDPEGRFDAQWIMALTPEEVKYQTTLTISYVDLSRPEDTFVFLPALRRHQPVSSAARCSPLTGTDGTLEDLRFGFDANITLMNARFISQRKILTLMDAVFPEGEFPDGYEMPLGWPKPSWGRWQLRDAYVISVSRIPSLGAGYCYGKRVVYVDKETSAPLWEDLFDSTMQPWKIVGLFFRTINVPGVGPVAANGSQVAAFWDIKRKHSSFFILPADNKPFFVNNQAPAQYNDASRYATPGGLDYIMR